MTNAHVLSLNKLYQPLGIIPLKDALKSLVKGRAEIVHVADEGYYENYNINTWMELSELKKEIEEDGNADWLVAGDNAIIEVPRIIRYLNYDRVRTRRVKLTRRNVFTRDNYTCLYCGEKKQLKDLQLEHIKPRAQGGKTIWTNVGTACSSCNGKKGARTPEEAGMKLIYKPFQPRFLPSSGILQDKDKYACWGNFISELYWNTELKK